MFPSLPRRPHSASHVFRVRRRALWMRRELIDLCERVRGGERERLVWYGIGIGIWWEWKWSSEVRGVDREKIGEG